MAMELDIIKTDTTWNDAAASLNNNFGKVKQAIAMGGGSGSGIVDTEMSDTSENAVQNKVIKEYVDKHPQYEVIEEVEVPDLPDNPEGSQGSVDLTGYATEEWVEKKGYATEEWVNNQNLADKAYVGSQINAYSSNTYALIAALEERVKALEALLEGAEGTSGCYFVPTGVTFSNNAISVSYDRVGVMPESLNVKTKAKIGESIATKESTVSPSLANLVTMFTIGINGDIATMLLPSQEYTVEITVETSDGNGTTTKSGTFTFTT
jgi:hypothetical protein